MLAHLVDAYDRIAEESLGLGDPEFHEIEDQLFDAIEDSGYRAVIKDGDIYLPDSNGLPGEIILVDPAGQEDLDDPKVLNLDKGLEEHPQLQPSDPPTSFFAGVQDMTDKEVRDLLHEFAAPLSPYVTSSARKTSAETLVKSLWLALITGPEVEEETWKILKKRAGLDDDLLDSIQTCYYEQMKPVVSAEQLTALRERYKVRRKT
jgi:hypothetical protein